jgi:hypothetical protein
MELKLNNLLNYNPWLTTWLLNVKMQSLNSHTYNLGYLGYLGDLIR